MEPPVLQIAILIMYRLTALKPVGDVCSSATTDDSIGML